MGATGTAPSSHKPPSSPMKITSRTPSIQASPHVQVSSQSSAPSTNAARVKQAPSCDELITCDDATNRTLSVFDTPTGDGLTLEDPGGLAAPRNGRSTPFPTDVDVFFGEVSVTEGEEARHFPMRPPNERDCPAISSETRIREVGEHLEVDMAQEARSFKAWMGIAAENGYNQMVSDRPLLIACRGLDPVALSRGEIVRHASRITPALDDTMVLLYQDPDGNPRVFVTEGATHAYQNVHRSASDMSGDGEPDVAMIQPGLYVAEHTGYHEFDSGMHVNRTDDAGRSDHIPTYRDGDQDSHIDADERALANLSSEELVERGWGAQVFDDGVHQGLYADGIYLHPDARTCTDGERGRRRTLSSTGCQTMPENALDFIASPGCRCSGR